MFRTHVSLMFYDKSFPQKVSIKICVSSTVAMNQETVRTPGQHALSNVDWWRNVIIVAKWQIPIHNTFAF